MVTRVPGFSKENFCSEKKLDSEEQKHKDTGGRNMRRKKNREEERMARGEERVSSKVEASSVKCCPEVH